MEFNSQHNSWLGNSTYERYLSVLINHKLHMSWQYYIRYFKRMDKRKDDDSNLSWAELCIDCWVDETLILTALLSCKNEKQKEIKKNKRFKNSSGAKRCPWNQKGFQHRLVKMSLYIQKFKQIGLPWNG